MASADVFDILQETPPSSRPIKDDTLREKKKKNVIRRPEGMKREVWDLIATDDSVPIVPTDTMYGGNAYATWIKHSSMKVRPWQWISFTNPSRTDNLQLKHWQRTVDQHQEYPFAKFNKHADIPSYTDSDYEQYLQDNDWSRDETDYLMDMCKQFDLRFIIIQDRWNDVQYKERSVEDIKERFYSVCKNLEYGRTGRHSGRYNYDADHERRRKTQLMKLYSRTRKEENDENYLAQELKRIESERKERERIISQDVQKFATTMNNNNNPEIDSTIQSIQQQTPPMDTSSTPSSSRRTSSTVTDLRRSISEKDKGALSNRNSTTSRGSIAEHVGIKFPEFKRPGVFLRSQRMHLPSSIPNKKLVVIDQVLKECQIERNPMACEEICEEFNDLRSDIVLLFDLKNALNSAEYELQTSLHRLKNTNESGQPHPSPSNSATDISKMLSSSSASLPSIITHPTTTATTTTGRLSDLFESTNSVRASACKRRTLSFQNSVLKKRGYNDASDDESLRNLLVTIFLKKLSSDDNNQVTPKYDVESIQRQLVNGENFILIIKLTGSDNVEQRCTCKYYRPFDGEMNLESWDCAKINNSNDDSNN
ncbi:unnamed protein product [Didymodactylos carnosus]|uniref:DNA methyltransferase 1-associated protein 1 n=1 Tax=Didymodactylos carnosus TaxID=1234261 RepID=A0A8S2QY67_9BILA|nr:unnamed protein product [Didymodactylos carnosus]CAF4134179.1 unnamed protein product [Didymodactylos carnosus]